jgi:RHS repeat-associated protein
MTDALQQIVWQANYAPFGEADITVNTVINNLRFPGQYFDQETNLHYNYFRYYDPATGRYITSDPIGLGNGFNTYLYVAANPMNFIDPTGLATRGEIKQRNKRRKERECDVEDDCKMPIEINNRGICDGHGPECFAAMRAAGIPGPYRSTTTTYSGACLMTFGIGFKATTFVGTTVAFEKAPGALSSMGFSGAANTAGRVAAVANNPATLAVGAIVGIGSILEHCKCDR